MSSFPRMVGIVVIAGMVFATPFFVNPSLLAVVVVAPPPPPPCPNQFSEITKCKIGCGQYACADCPELQCVAVGSGSSLCKETDPQSNNWTTPKSGIKGWSSAENPKTEPCMLQVKCYLPTIKGKKVCSPCKKPACKLQPCRTNNYINTKCPPGT